MNSTLLIAFALGVRHGTDPDHLTAIDGMDSALFGVLLPEIRDWFGVTLTTAVTLQTVAVLFTILAAVPIGLGTVSEYSRSRVPRPPQNRTTFISRRPSLRGSGR